MNKDEALEFLGLNENTLTIENIDKKSDMLSRLCNPEFDLKDSVLIDRIQYKPDEIKYGAIKEAAEFLKDYVHKKNIIKEEQKFINGTEIQIVRNQNDFEPASDYIKFLKEYYENIIKQQVKTIKEINEKQSTIEDKEAEEVVQPVENKQNDIQNSQGFDINSFTSPVFPNEEETLDDATPDLDESKPNVTVEAMDEAIKNAENDITPKTLDSIETPVVQPVIETPIEESVVQPVNVELTNVLNKLTMGVNYNTAMGTAKRLTAKSIQVTKSFVSYLKNAEFKCQLKKQINKVVRVPEYYFKQVGQKITSLKDHNQEIINENLSKLNLDELKILTDEYYNNGLNNFDEITKKAIKGYILKAQEANAIDANELVEDEKTELTNSTDKIDALNSMSNALVDNEPQKQVYENLIKQQYDGVAEKIKDIREQETDIKVKEEDKGNFFENIINKLPFGHKEKTDEQSSEYQLYVGHKKALENLKELENKAILAHDDVNALQAYNAIQEQEARLSEEEERLMGNGKSL